MPFDKTSPLSMDHSGLPEQGSTEYLSEGQNCLKQATSFQPVASRERLSIKLKSSTDTLSSKSNTMLLSRRTLRLLSLLSAKSLQSRPPLGDPMDCSLPGSSVHGILQA